MKLAYSTLACPAWGLQEILSAAESYGFDGVELRMVNGEVDLHHLPDFQEKHLAATRERFDRSGIEVICVDTSVQLAKVAGPAKDEQLAIVDAMSQIAGALDAPYIRVFGGEFDGPPTAPAAKALADIGRITEQHGVTALLETHDSFSTATLVAEVVALASRDVEVGVLWDVLHTYRTGESLAESSQAAGNSLRLVHLKDSASYSPQGFDLTLIGDGTVPIQDAVRLLRERAYEGFVSFEWEKGWHPELAEPDVALPHFVSYMRRLEESR